MSYCNACGGKLGIDCFNPSECAYITESMKRNEVHNLEMRIAELASKLNTKS